MRKKYFLHILLLLFITITKAQNVGINTDGSQPHVHAMLDIKSSTKGVLFPRTSGNSRRNIPAPATGLILLDTTENAFFHFNGTHWAQQIDSMNYLWKKAGNVYYVPEGINIGINTLPINKLHLHDINASQLRFTNNSTGTTGTDGFVLGINAAGVFTFENKEPGRNISFSANGGFVQHLLVASTGEIGFNNTINPPSALSVKGGLGQKIIFYNTNASQGFGIGVQNNALQIHASGISSTIDIGYGRSGINFNRVLQIKGTGELDINGKLTRPARSGSTDLLPIAFGKVLSDGTKSGAAGNWTVTKIAEGKFELQFPDENLAGDANRYIMQVSPYKQLPGDHPGGVSFSTQIENGKYIIQMGTFWIDNETNPNCDIGSAECSLFLNLPGVKVRTVGFGFVLHKL